MVDFLRGDRLCKDPRSESIVRYHLCESGLQKALKQAVKLTRIEKRINCHIFRHSFATHLLQNGYNIRTVKELLGHKDVKTTMICTHVLNRGGKGVISPFDTSGGTHPKKSLLICLPKWIEPNKNISI